MEQKEVYIYACPKKTPQNLKCFPDVKIRAYFLSSLFLAWLLVFFAPCFMSRNGVNVYYWSASIRFKWDERYLTFAKPLH